MLLARISVHGALDFLYLPLIGADSVFDISALSDRFAVLPDGSIVNEHIKTAKDENVNKVNDKQHKFFMLRDQHVDDIGKQCKDDGKYQDQCQNFLKALMA